MARSNPFGDYGTVDLAGLYSAQPGPGSSSGTVIDPATGIAYDPNVPGPNNPMNRTLAPGTATPQEAMNAAPAWGQMPGMPAPPPNSAGSAGIDAYWQAVAEGLLDGSITPEMIAGRETGSHASARDAGPEANLTAGAYAGTQLYAVMTPEQAARVKYVDDGYTQFLLDQVKNGRGDAIMFTRSLEQQAYAGTTVGANDHQTFAGSAPDLMNAIQIARQADYAQYAARMRASGGEPVSQADYEGGMGLRPIDPNAGPSQGRGLGGTAVRDSFGHVIPSDVTPTQAAAVGAIRQPAYNEAADTSFTNRGMTPAPYPVVAPVAPPSTSPTGTTPSATPLTGAAAGPATAPGVTAPPKPAAPPDYAKLAATNAQYAANIAKVPAAERTPAQNASLAAADAKAKEYAARANAGSSTQTGTSKPTVA